MLTAGDRNTSCSSPILAGWVNDLKTTFRGRIAIEGAIDRVETPYGDRLTRKPCTKSTD